ncbi:MAG TPA: hypothetical protein VNC59_03600 [Thermoanaerobaculia bacterium]|nr:hypothetical protein [Thermoanaerobaculia bacterium]
MTLRRWIEYLVAVLAGNAIYFVVLFPVLPQGLRHEPLQADAGLLLAFLLCVAMYGVIRLGSRHAQAWIRKSEAEDVGYGKR